MENKISFAVKKATNYLLKGNKITDDTVIHSFFDNLKLSVHTIDSIKCSGLQTFIEEVANNWKTLDSSSVVFGLQVTAWLAENDYRHFKSNIHKVFSILCRDVLVEDLADTSVLTALFTSLSTLARQKESLQWIICDKQISDIAVEGLRLVTVSSSIFLEKAVINYLSVVILGLDTLDRETDVSDCVSFSSRILNTTLQNIRKHYAKKHLGPFVAGSVQCLETLCRQSEVTGKCLLTKHTDFCEYLVDLVGILKGRDCDTVMNIIDAVLHVGMSEDSSTVNGELKCHLIGRIEKQLTDLACEGNIVTAQKLAACCLKIEGSVRLREKSVAIFTEPVYWLLDINVKGSLFSEHNLQAALSVKCRCTDIVCRSLDGHIMGVSLITDILGRTRVFSGYDDKPNSKALSYMYKNRIVQRRCLEIFTSVKPEKMEDKMSLLSEAQIIVELFRESDSDTVIYSLCSQLLQEWIPSLFTYEETISVTVTLAQVIQNHLSALQWELRDTTLDLLGNMIASCNDNTFIIKWLIDYGLHIQLWKCVMDGESYVRASAISAVYHLCLCPHLLSALIESGLVSNETLERGYCSPSVIDLVKQSTDHFVSMNNDIIQTVKDIVNKDTEAFARRSAITFLFKFFKIKISLKVKDRLDVVPDVVIATIVTATKDFDWEVKLVALEFVRCMIQLAVSEHVRSRKTAPEISEYARGLCYLKSAKESEVKVDTGLLLDKPCNKLLVNVLFDSLDDYDEKICEKAYDIISELQLELRALTTSNKVTGKGTFSTYSDQILKDEGSKDVTVGDECEIKKRKFDRILSSETKETVKCSEVTSLELNTKTENSENNFKDVRHSGLSKGVSWEYNENSRVESTAEKYEDMLNKILDYDLSVYKLRLEEVHNSSARLLSLVEDILTSENKTSEDNSVDCY